jgi:tetrapyrrole methylase family protein/MazG family protein
MARPDKKSDPEKLKSAFLELYEIISLLRGPDGCPWDREQTLESLRPNLIDEAYECLEAIDEKNPAHLREELGDLFLILILMARLNEEAGAFNLEESLREIAAKLIRRHPHVFDEKRAASIPEIIRNWDYIKEHVEGKKRKEGLFAEMNNALPPLEKAHKIQKKAAKIGFDWPTVEPVFDKLQEEMAELQAALRKNDPAQTEDEVGDLLFTLVNIARQLDIDPSLALEKTNRKVLARFRKIEEYLKEMKIDFAQTNLELLDSLWEKAKKDKTD